MKEGLLIASLALAIVVPSCTANNASPAKELINEINLKRGDVISCGTSNQKFGTTDFEISSGENVKADFNLAVELLHSFEYDDAEKAFAKVIDKEPSCAMAFWGVAMSNFHPLWTPPSESELQKGAKAIGIARSLKASPREGAYIAAIADFYSDWEHTDHKTRCLRFESGMEKVYKAYPEDKEAAIFYALSLDAAADPADKTFTRQKKAGEILNSLYPDQPNHPGIVHYLIHTYDYPQLAERGLDAARKYASVAPSSAHALHMPSHIFTRLGLWNECIRSNMASVTSAQCYAQSAGIKGHWDEELHGLDYLVYAYLQKGDNDSAKQQLDYLMSMNEVNPVNFKVAYAYAAIPSRYVLENHMWKEAAALEVKPQKFSWQKFPWQEAIIHFTRLLGSVNSGDLHGAHKELSVLQRLRDTLVNQKDAYKANQVSIQIKTSEAWIFLKEGKTKDALAAMELAAEMEESTEKHPVTPGEVLPARELYADMLLELNMTKEALAAYEADLKGHPNRFNALYGAGVAAQRSGDPVKEKFYFDKLLQTTGGSTSNRAEVARIRNISSQPKR